MVPRARHFSRHTTCKKLACPTTTNSEELVVKIPSLEKLLEDQLKDLYSAEKQLVKALPKVAKKASSEELQEAIESHLEETRGQVERLDEIAEILDIRVTGKKCMGMEGLLEEGEEGLEAEGPEAVIDNALIAAAQRIEHYEISAYGSARALAEKLGKQDVVKLLQESLDEETAADEKLTGIAESLQAAAPLSAD
jgi:ferritin-like metal-binding protein YciE